MNKIERLEKIVEMVKADKIIGKHIANSLMVGACNTSIFIDSQNDYVEVYIDAPKCAVFKSMERLVKEAGSPINSACYIAHDGSCRNCIRFD